MNLSGLSIQESDPHRNGPGDSLRHKRGTVYITTFATLVRDPFLSPFRGGQVARFLSSPLIL